MCMSWQEACRSGRTALMKLPYLSLGSLSHAHLLVRLGKSLLDAYSHQPFWEACDDPKPTSRTWSLHGSMGVTGYPLCG